jgi:hypothetical protein
MSIQDPLDRIARISELSEMTEVLRRTSPRVDCFIKPTSAALLLGYEDMRTFREDIKRYPNLPAIQFIPRGRRFVVTLSSVIARMDAEKALAATAKKPRTAREICSDAIPSKS